MEFAELGKDAKSVAGFSPSRQFRVGRNDVNLTRPGCQRVAKTKEKSKLFGVTVTFTAPFNNMRTLKFKA